ncbi:MAG: LamG domain-containing protein [Candidatus Heimdallarchaeota archaeon]
MNIIKSRIIVLTMLIFSLMLLSVNGLTYTIDDINLQDSNTINLTWTGTNYETETGYSNARWTSDVISFEEPITISNITGLTYDYNNLPNNNQIGNVDMTGNMLLLHFDNDNGIVIDSSGNDFNGFTVGGAIRIDNGIHNTKALNIDNNGFAQISHNNDLNIQTFGTLSFAYYHTENADQSFISKEDTAGNTGYKVGIRGGDMRLTIDFNDGASRAESNNVPFPTLNQWYFVVIVWTSTSVEFYVNGDSWGTDTIPISYIPNVFPLIIGGNNDGTELLRGRLDEIAMWNRSISYTEVVDVTTQMIVDKTVKFKSCNTILCAENYTILDGSVPYNIDFLNLDDTQYYRIEIDFERMNIDFDNNLDLLTFDYEIVPSIVPVEKDSQVYKTFGGDNYGTFNTGVIGFWNSQTLQITEIESGSKAVNNPDNLVTPKIAYLDDNEKYIISRDSDNLILLQWDGEDGNLNAVDGVDVIPSGHTLLTDFIVRKYRDHNYILFITVSSGYSYLNYVSYDGNIFDINSRSLGANGRIRRSSQPHHLPFFNCFEDEELCVYGKSWYQQAFSVIGFTLTDNLELIGSAVNSPLEYHKSPYAARDVDDCVYTPIGSNIILGDVDNDFTQGDEYDYDDVVIGYNFQGAFQLISLNINSTHLWKDWGASRSSGVNSGCNGGTAPHLQDPPLEPSKWMTGTLAHEYNGFPADGKELFFGGIMSDTDNFVIYEFTANGDYEDRHPDLNNLEGQLYSNPFVLDCFPESGETDIGILGYRDNNKLLLECSCHDCSGNDDCEFDDFEESFNISKIQNPAKSVHILESDDSYHGSEIVTPLGIFGISEIEPGLTCDNDYLTKIYMYGEGDSFVIPIDYENNDRADLISSSPFVLKYMDDGFVNKKPVITNIKINPCISKETVKLGSDLLVKVSGSDEELNDVSYRIITYAGHENETDSGWSNWHSSGDEYTYQSTFHTIIGIGYIQIYIKDASHTEYNMIEKYFSVNDDNESVSFGDCEDLYDADDLAEEQDLEPSIQPTDDDYLDEFGNKLNDNAVKNGMEELGGYVGIGGLLMYLIIMFGVALGMFFYVGMGSGHGASKLGAIAIVEILMLIIGTVLKIIPVSIIIILILAMVVIIGFWGRSYFTGSRQNFD